MASYKRPVITAAVIVLLMTAGGVFWFTRVTPDRVIQAFTEGGEIRLREVLRPAEDGPWVIVFGIDGLGSRQFFQALERGAIPNISALMGDSIGEGVYTYAVAYDSMLTVLPSSTMGAWTSLFTGRPPGETGVPGNEWFDRETLRFYAPAPVSVKDNRHTIDMLLRNLLGEAIAGPTIFETIDRRSYVSFLPVHRGADLFTTPDPIVVGDLFLHLARGMAGAPHADYDSYAALDRQSIARMKHSIRRHGLADLQVIYLPGLDMYSHVTADVLNRQIAYLHDVVDPLVGEVVDVYREGGVLDDTYVVIVSDHGHTPVLNDRRHAHGTGDEDPPGIMERSGFRVRPFTIELGGDNQDFQSVVAYQGAMAFIYVADRSQCENPGTSCDWRRPARMQEDVMPLVQAFYEANREGTHAPKLKGTLEMVLARTPVAPGSAPTPFHVYTGGEFISIETFIRQNERQDLVAFSRRMDELALGTQGYKAGDIILVAKSGLERPITERFYFSDLYHSWHGSATAQDSYVPFIIAKAGGDGSALLETASRLNIDQPTQMHLAPVIEALFQQHDTVE